MSYKLLTYRDSSGAERAGILVDGEIYDVSAVTGTDGFVSTLDILNNWESAREELRLAAAKIVSEKIIGWPLTQVELLAPILYSGAIYCAGANYADHIQEMMRARNLPDDIDPRKLVGQDPWHCLKTSQGSVLGSGSSTPMPTHTKALDWEGELVAVIGRVAKNVTVEDALDYVAGYTIGNDLSARDLGMRNGVPDTSPFKWDWLGQKCFDGAFPVGPWITPADDIPDPLHLEIKLWVNDQIKQDSDTSKLIFGVAEQIAHLSTRITLRPGDMIATGTPAGVGAARNEFLKSGDKVRIYIEKIGELTHAIS